MNMLHEMGSSATGSKRDVEKGGEWMLNKEGHVPLYIQLKDLIQQQIESGVYPEGTAIPSERELCNMYNVSRITVRQAIDRAVSEGFLVKRPGKGTYVSSRKIQQSLERITSFGTTMTGQGLIAQTSVLEVRNVYASDRIYDILQANKQVPVLRLVLLGTANAQPLAIYTSYFRPEIGQRIADIALDWASQGRAFSSFDLYESIDHELRPVVARQTFEAGLASGKVARYLKLEDPAVVFIVESVAESETGVPVEYKIAHYRADRYKFSISRKIGT
jgi:GntR family transcriptional regulator